MINTPSIRLADYFPYFMIGYAHNLHANSMQERKKKRLRARSPSASRKQPYSNPASFTPTALAPWFYDAIFR